MVYKSIVTSFRTEMGHYFVSSMNETSFNGAFVKNPSGDQGINM